MYFNLFYLKRYLPFIVATVLLVSCMVGPDFHHPAPPRTNHYIEGQSPEKTVATPGVGVAGKSQRFVENQSIPGQWWHIFHSPQLNTLINMGLANNPNLAAAKASLNQAQANYSAQFGALFPTVNGNFSAERQRFSLSQFGGTNATPVGSRVFNLYNANVVVTYTLDVFGGIRRQIEAAGAQVDYQQFELEAAFLTLSSNIVTTAITIASLKAQLQATYQLIHSQEKTLSLVKQQLALGGSSQATVLLQMTQLEQTRASLPPLKQNLAINLHALSALIGELPREGSLPQFDLDKLNLPADLPLSCPSSLVQQRPDVRAAEALLHAASAQIGVAIANMLPQLNLSANYGWQSTVLSTLFDSKNKVWDITSAIAQPIFNGGSLIAKKRAALAAYELAAAQYKQTVLVAFQNVADTLSALEQDAQLLKAQKAAESAAKASLNIVQKQFRLGGANYLDMLTAERNYQLAIISRIQAQAARYSDTAALFQALGGGWWNRPPLTCNLLLKQNIDQYKPGCFGKIKMPLKNRA